MSNYVAKFICGIIVTSGLVAGALASAEDRTPNPRPFEKSCRKLADLAAYGWADVERSVNISCLGSGAIPTAAYDSMVQGFLADCTDVVIRKVGAGLDSPGRHDARFSRDELTRMFVRRYDPVYRQYCSRMNPGKGIVTRPGSLTEV